MTELIRYRNTDDGVVRITLNRPHRRNAQNVALLHELDASFTAAARDEKVRVVVLDAEGPDFSAGHDVKDPDWPDPERSIGLSNRYGERTIPGWVERENEIYLGLCRRWHNMPLPTIAAVRGRCIGGGLMLAWVCDIIIASETAQFCDPVISLGANGVEWFVHAWELGHRKAKELLLTGASWDAQEAHRLGMVNRVVPDGDLEAETLAMARTIAAQPPFAARLAKESVNASLRSQGMPAAIDTAYWMHQLSHADNWLERDLPIDPSRLPESVRFNGFATYAEHRTRQSERPGDDGGGN